MARKQESMIILASEDDVKEYSCKHCGNATLIAATNPCCFHCGEDLGKGKTLKHTLTASTKDGNTETVSCQSCNTSMNIVNSDQTADDIALSAYCVVCGSENLTVDEENEDDNENVDENESISKENSKVMEDEENSTKEALTSSVINPETLQWSVVNNKTSEDGTLVASSPDTGLPLIVFHKENAPNGVQSLFASSGFVNAFVQIAASNGLGVAVKQFGGNFFKSEEIIASIDLEQMALDRLEDVALPKIIACCQTAVEGGMKGIYTDIGASLQNCLVNEIVASGVPSDRAQTAVNNAFALHGSTMFGAIIAKACELFNKSEDSLNEVKELIAKAEGPTFVSYDPVQVETQTILNKQDIVASTSVTMQTSSNVSSLRKQLFG